MIAATGPVGRGARDDRTEQAVNAAGDGRREDGTIVLVALQPLEGLRAELRREVDQIVRYVEKVARVAQRLGRMRLRRRVPLAGHIALRHGTLLDRPDRIARDA